MSFRHPLAKPSISQLGKDLVRDVLDSGNLSYGAYSQQFESLFSKRHGSRFGILSNSGTSSLQVALASMKASFGWQDGNTVLVPATTFVATANIVLMCGLRPIFVDIEPNSFGMDPRKMEDAIEDDTVAVIPVHLFGMPCKIKEICEVALNNGLKVLEDSCETVGASVDGIPVGAWGDVACFSFYVCHTVSTGVGGMATTSDPALAAMMRSLVNHGRKAGWINGVISHGGDIEDRFVFERLGFSYRVTEMEAALGVAAMQDFEREAALRLGIANNLHALLRAELGHKVHSPEPCGVPMMFPMVIRPTENVDKWDVMRKLEAVGIETREMLPLLSQPFYKEMGHKLSDFRCSQWVKENGFYVGIYPGMTINDCAEVIGEIKKAIVNEQVLA